MLSEILMKKKNIDFVGVVVKIDGKEVIVKKENCYFRGWEWEDDNIMERDCGVDLEMTIKENKYTLSL